LKVADTGTDGMGGNEDVGHEKTYWLHLCSKERTKDFTRCKQEVSMTKPFFKPTLFHAITLVAFFSAQTFAADSAPILFSGEHTFLKWIIYFLIASAIGGGSAAKKSLEKCADAMLWNDQIRN
jgi:hypothetical protein